MAVDFISARILQSAQLPEVEPIEYEAGPLVLVTHDMTLGVARQPSGAVKVNCIRGEVVAWSESLLPEEAKWLRTALAKIGY